MMKFEQLLAQFEAIAEAPVQLLSPNVLGKSRQGRDLHGFCFGSGETRVSLIVRTNPTQLSRY